MIGDSVHKAIPLFLQVHEDLRSNYAALGATLLAVVIAYDSEAEALYVILKCAPLLI